jgi:hypothetical protein
VVGTVLEREVEEREFTSKRKAHNIDALTCDYVLCRISCFQTRSLKSSDCGLLEEKNKQKKKRRRGEDSRHSSS